MVVYHAKRQHDSTCQAQDSSPLLEAVEPAFELWLHVLLRYPSWAARPAPDWSNALDLLPGEK